MKSSEKSIRFEVQEFKEALLVHSQDPLEYNS